MTATDPTTLALTGQLPFIFSLGAILALPLSFLLLRLYRRAVLKGMNRRSERPTDSRKAEAAVRAEQGQSASGDLRLSIVDAAAEQSDGHAGGTLYRRACSNPWRAGLVYLAGGCLFAAVITFSFLRASNSEILIGFILFAALGWLALQWIRRRYQAKSVNDQSLILDALWLLFGVSYAVGLVFEGAAWILSGLAAFAAYRVSKVFTQMA